MYTIPRTAYDPDRVIAEQQLYNDGVMDADDPNEPTFALCWMTAAYRAGRDDTVRDWDRGVSVSDFARGEL